MQEHIEYKGTRWYKCDLHLHTIASKCFQNDTVTPEQWVDRAIEQGLNCVAITDHNIGTSVDAIKEAAKVNQHVAIIRPIIEKVLPKYLQKMLVSKSIKDELVTMSETSLSREAITKPQLDEFKIPLPSIEVQKDIVERIGKLEIEINKSQKVIDEASDKKKEILRKYL